MTRRFIALFSCLSLLVMAAHADHQAIEINLNVQNGYSDTTALKEADLYITAIPDDSNDQAQIKLEIKNQSEEFGLLLFDRGYTEKDTKSKDWKNQYFEINWDDQLKNNGPVEATTGLIRPVFFIDLSETRVLPVQMKIGNGGAEFNLAIYLCKIEKRNKKNQSQPQKVKMKFDEIHPIKINLELGPDTEFEQLKVECEDFIKTINHWSFCPCEGGSGCKMKKHHPNLDGQVKELDEKVNAKKDHIRAIARMHGFQVLEEIKKTKYQTLIDEIQQAFDTRVEDVLKNPEKLKKCTPCRQPGPIRKCNTCYKPLKPQGTCTGYHCKVCKVMISKGKEYCKKHDITWKQAGKKWEAIYTELKNNKKYTCKTAIKEANAIYNKVKDKPDEGKKSQALRSYRNIQSYCK